METYKDHITLSPDMNEERLNTLRELFPDWFTQEGFRDINEVKKAANPNSVDETERYEFRWFGKTAAKTIKIIFLFSTSIFFAMSEIKIRTKVSGEKRKKALIKSFALLKGFTKSMEMTGVQFTLQR